LLEPIMKEARGPELAPAQLALGMAWLRLGRGEAAADILRKASESMAGTPQ
jgi:hypothetical protein